MRKAILISLFLLVGCGEDNITTVERKSLDVVVNASGELESKTTAIIAPPSVSRMWQYKINFLIPENTQVTKGTAVVSFDDKTVSDSLTDKKSELERAQKELENKRLKEEETEEELVLAAAEMDMEYEKAKRRAEIVDNSRSENDRKKVAIDFTIAENDLFLANEKLKFHRENTKLNLKLAQGKVDRLTAEVNGLLHDMERLKVVAPIDGMVIYKANWQGEKPAVGESVQFGQPVIELSVIEEMQIKAQINEPDSGKVKVGQLVKVVVDGAQEYAFNGKVESLGRVFRDKSYQDKRRIVDAIISFSPTEDFVARPGMSARIEIITNSLNNVLAIPADSIRYQDEQPMVTVNSTFSSEQRTIKVEQVVGNSAIVSEGLKENEEIVL
ncbi:efflux RND transporter periplasmic adaptor subunit [Thalassotalea fusca]